MAISQDFNYAPRLKTVRTTYSDGTSSVTESVVASKRRVFSKPSNINNPLIAGWRSPSNWYMNYFDSDRYMQDCVIRSTHSSGAIITWTGTGHLVKATVPARLPASLGARAELAALLKLKNAKVNLGVSFGERKEAAGMMYSNLGKVAKSYRQFRRGNFQSAARELGLGWRDAPNRWLEYQYGWKPLLSDVYTACKEINEKDKKEESRTYYHVKARVSDSKKVQSSESRFAGTRSIYTDSHQFDAFVRFDFRPNSDMGLFQELDEWGVLNPAEIAWELVPFSFVVDWAVPVGDFLSAITAPVPYIFRGGSKTTFEKATRDAVLQNVSLLSASGRGSDTYRSMSRLTYGTFPFPDPRVFTAFKNASSESIATRTANALSIISGAFR